MEHVLADQVAVVTGAGRGLGRSFALGLARAGAAVVVNSASETNAMATALAIGDEGGRAIAVAGDVGDPATATRLVEAAVNELGGLHIVVNNAGISRAGMFWTLTDEDWDDVIRVNLTGSFYVMRAAAPVLMDQRYGRIITMTSAGGIDGSPAQANYGAAKAGVIGLTKSAARQLARYGITVNAVAPVAETPMMQPIMDRPDLLEKTLARIPMGRVAHPDEIVPAVVFLASPGASYITGVVLLADGGMSM